MALTPSRRSELRSDAHKLNPIVIIGDKGLTDEVIAEIDRSLKAHELIKVRANTNDRDARELWMEKICEQLKAEAVQQIGKILVVYRQNVDKPTEDLTPQTPTAPRRSGTDDPRKRKKAEQKRRLEAATTRTSRPRFRTPSPRPESGSRRRRRSTSQ